MRQLLLLLHLFGFVLWMGGGLAAMSTGLLMRTLPRNQLAVTMLVQGRLMRGMILPGAVLVVLSGLLLTLRLYGSATSVNGFPVPLMVMQAAGLLAAGIVLVVMVPTAARLSRLDPVGEYGPLFDALRRRAATAGMITGLLALAALIGGALMR